MIFIKSLNNFGYYNGVLLASFLQNLKPNRKGHRLKFEAVDGAAWPDVEHMRTADNGQGVIPGPYCEIKTNRELEHHHENETRPTFQAYEIKTGDGSS